MPIPVSATSMRTLRSSPPIRSAMLPPGSVYLIALSSRFERICSQACGRPRRCRAARLVSVAESCFSSSRGRQSWSSVSASLAVSIARQLEAGLAALDLRELEQVRHDGAQPACVAVDHLEVGAPVGLGERGAAEQRLGEAADRGEGRAQLVRGIGDEFAAHLLELHQLRHVVQHGDRPRARGAAGRQAHGVHAQRAVHGVRHLDRPGDRLVGVLGRLEHLGELGVADRFERRAAAQLAGHAEEVAQVLVAEQDPLVRVDHQHAFDHSVEHRLQLLLLARRELGALAELLGHALERGRDLAELVAEAQREPVAEIAGRDRGGHPPHLADRPQHASREQEGDQQRGGDGDRGRGEPGGAQRPEQRGRARREAGCRAARARRAGRPRRPRRAPAPPGWRPACDGSRTRFPGWRRAARPAAAALTRRIDSRPRAPSQSGRPPAPASRAGASGGCRWCAP